VCPHVTPGGSRGQPRGVTQCGTDACSTDNAGVLTATLSLLSSADVSCMGKGTCAVLPVQPPDRQREPRGWVSVLWRLCLWNVPYFQGLVELWVLSYAPHVV
jgi:hypothetical protein